MSIQAGTGINLLAQDGNAALKPKPKSDPQKTQKPPSPKDSSTAEDVDNVLGATIPGFIISTGYKMLRGEGPVEAASNTISEASQGFSNLRNKLGRWLTGQ